MSEPLNTPSVDQMRQMLYARNGGSGASSAPVGKVKQAKDGSIELTEEIIAKIKDGLIDDATQTLKPALTQTITDIATMIEKDIRTNITKAQKSLVDATDEKQKAFDQYAQQAIADLTQLAQQVRPIEVGTPDSIGYVKVSGVQHDKFELLLRIIGAGLPVFMVGPAGTGKTAGAENAATALGLEFYAMSVGSQTSKADIFGYKDAQGNYHATPFRHAYENGGVFLLDEADAGNANVLVGLNAALSNGYVFFPDDKMTKMHKDFRMVATANTFGNGASRQYVGRNQLDAATLDRFTVITWDIDARIEEAIAAKSPTFGERWLKVVREVRTEAIDKLELRAVVSPRATLRGATLLEQGVEYEHAVEVALLANMPEAERDALRTIANAAWAKTAPKARAKRTTPQLQKKVDTTLDDLIQDFEGEGGLTEGDHEPF